VISKYSTSYPYLAVAVHYDVSYADVLEYADQIPSATLQRSQPWQLATWAAYDREQKPEIDLDTEIKSGIQVTYHRKFIMIKEALNAFALSAAKVWGYDRSNTVGASEIGGCARKAFYEKNRKIKTGVKFRANRTSRENIKRYEPDQDYVDGWGARMRGNLIENHLWVPALKKRFKKNLIMAGKDQKSLFKGFLSATPDGLVINQPRDTLKAFGIADIGEGRCFVVEGKSIDPRVPLAEAKSENVYQVHCQLGLIRECTKYRPEYALISYIDASFHDSVTEFVIKFNPHIYKRAKIRATEIKTAKSPMELKPEGWIAGGKECEYCAFLGPCNIARFNLPNSEKPVDDQFKAEIIDMCRSLNEVKTTKE